MSVDAALPDLGPAPHRSADLGRRIRFAIYTAILVVLVCLAASVLTQGSGAHRGHRARSSAHVAPRASVGDLRARARTDGPRLATE